MSHHLQSSLLYLIALLHTNNISFLHRKVSQVRKTVLRIDIPASGKEYKTALHRMLGKHHCGFKMHCGQLIQFLISRNQPSPPPLQDAVSFLRHTIMSIAAPRLNPHLFNKCMLPWQSLRLDSTLLAPFMMPLSIGYDCNKGVIWTHNGQILSPSDKNSVGQSIFLAYSKQSSIEWLQMHYADTDTYTGELLCLPSCCTELHITP